jgi:hypothetical protein
MANTLDNRTLDEALNMTNSNMIYIASCYSITFCFLGFNILAARREHRKIIKDILRKRQPVAPLKDL